MSDVIYTAFSSMDNGLVMKKDLFKNRTPHDKGPNVEGVLFVLGIFITSVSISFASAYQPGSGR